MDKFAENIKNLLSACTPYAWLLPVIGLAIIGIAMAIPSEKTKEFAKSHWGGVERFHFNLDEKIHSSAMKVAEEN